MNKKINLGFLKNFKFWVLLLLLLNLIYLRSIGERIGHLDPQSQSALNEIFKQYPNDLPTGLFYAIKNGTGNMDCGSADTVSSIQGDINTISKDIEKIQAKLGIY